MVRLDARLELRLDKATLAELERQAAAGHVSVAELVRLAIARELQGSGSGASRRARALERGLSLDVPVPSDPAVLARELDAAYRIEAAAPPAGT